MSRAKSTLEQWRIVQAVVDFGGYAQAAEQLNKSQSSLNHAVAKLQHQLGINLLEVRGRKAYLTEQGEVLLRRSRHLTQSVEELEQLATNLGQGWEPNLTIAREIVYPIDTLVEALNAFLPQSRGTRVTVLDTVLTGTNELIQNNQVDLAICATPPKGHIAEPLCDAVFELVCHPEHPLAQLDVIEDDKQLAQHLQIVIKDTGVKSTNEIGWLKAEQRWTVSNFHEAKAILAKNIGFCWMPSFIVEHELMNKQLTRLHLRGSSQRKTILNLVIPNRDQQGPASKLLEELILKQHAK
ncbi:LysR family transcriptional regulator [Shewanella inventionis]|uniref:LysR family transcriptional regulator n=1 Tax=Shewanella inventionis TaxID=1738770 RepID=A0ABQ1IQ84_9GAMM|nr:LysR family transcriptional regulator [Shewanella inventionis]MCL1157222.1 LysR family transcriptional regulator [Shewanella inventionis]GGB48916.1 LysR family transcriptional regulator [Shewanella inventionis]